MHVRDLTGSERTALFALLAHMAEADGRIAPGEVIELDDLAEELGVDSLREELMRTRATVQTDHDLLRQLDAVVRPDAQELILTLLSDLAQSDGERGDEERALIERVRAAWA